MQYQIGLCNVWWTNEDINYRYFETKELKEKYFLDLGVNYNNLINLEINDNVDMTVLYTNSFNETIEQVLSKNYCLIKNTITNVTRYYFINDIKQDSGLQFILSLTLDDITTHYIDLKNSSSSFFVKRCHASRFYYRSGWRFDNRENSLMFLEEDRHQLNKIMIDRQPIVLHNYPANRGIETWIQDNVDYWVYVFLDKNHKYKSRNFVDNSINDVTIQPNLYYTYFPTSSLYQAEYGVVCYPVYKTYGQLYFKNKNLDGTYTTVSLGKEGLDNFRELNNDTSYFYSTKISRVSPFWSNSTTSLSYEMQGYNMILYNNLNNDSTYTKVVNTNIICTNYERKNGLIYGERQHTNNIETERITLDLPFGVFPYVLERDMPINHLYNPKLYSAHYREILIRESGNSFSYDPLKYGSNFMECKYTEPLQSETTRSYTRLKANNLYYDGTDYNYTGLVINNDNSMTVVNDTYAQFLANNRNFWLQSSVNAVSSILDAKLGSALSKGLDTLFTFDNLLGAPDSLKNANGSSIFSTFVNPFNQYLEYVRCLDSDLEVANNYMHKYGYRYEQFNSLNNVDNIRYLFNYLEVEIDYLPLNISNYEKTRLKDRLKSIRFWNTDTVNYNIENIENEVLQ